MKRTIVWVFSICAIALISGCSITGEKKTVLQQKESISEEKMQEPYGKYSLETADIQVWFYDNEYVYFDRGEKVIRKYKSIDSP